jgi:aromatic-amino-acid transaminase
MTLENDNRAGRGAGAPTDDAQRSAMRPSLATLKQQPDDALLALIAKHKADPRADKIDVGVGVYRDADGQTPVMRAVKMAERLLVDEQGSKSYLGPEGNAGFVDLLAPLVFGTVITECDRMTGVQTPGGTGALRLGAELIARSSPASAVFIGVPSWPNHVPIFREAGLGVEEHRYYDAVAGRIDFDGMMDALNKATPGDVILLHASCHNPTGTGFSKEQWVTLTERICRRGLLPFVDLAYQGLGDGWDVDAEGMRYLMAAVPEALVAYSCDKNFGLYRERVGALWVQTVTAATAGSVRSNLFALARSLWSMPPDHGAAVVHAILERPVLQDHWRAELNAMQIRILELRKQLAEADPRMAAVGEGRGLFAMLPLVDHGARMLSEMHGIYMADSGRINIAGLRGETIERFTASVVPLLRPA